jgi:hypothetical protein
MESVRSLAAVRDKDAIPLLERIVQEDRAEVPTASGESFPVREQARRALKAKEERTDHLKMNINVSE